MSAYFLEDGFQLFDYNKHFCLTNSWWFTWELQTDMRAIFREVLQGSVALLSCQLGVILTVNSVLYSLNNNCLLDTLSCVLVIVAVVAFELI